MKRNQNGFGIIGIIVVLLVLSVLGFATWYFLKSKPTSDAPSKQSTTSSTRQTEETTKTAGEERFVTPAHYMEYKNAEIGFSFAYPKSVGELTAADTGGNPSYVGYYKSADTRDAFLTHTQSPLYVSINEVDGYVGSAAKYGPMLEYKDGKWIVSDKQGGDVNHGNYSIGDVFPAKIAKTIESNPVYDFSYTDEGCYRSRWTFKKDQAFVNITLPAVCADSIDTIPQDRLDAYKKESDIVLKSLQLQ
jgi:hypothetical protein